MGLFLLVDLAADGLAIARHTKEVPGSRADAVVLSSKATNGVYLHESLTRLGGFTQQQAQDVVTAMRKLYSEVDIVASRGGATFVRTRLRQDEIHAKPLGFLGRLESQFGPLWHRVEAGGFQMRCRVADREQAAQQAARLESYYLKAGIACTTRVAELDAAEVAIWDGLQGMRVAAQ